MLLVVRGTLKVHCENAGSVCRDECLKIMCIVWVLTEELPCTLQACGVVLMAEHCQDP